MGRYKIASKTDILRTKIAKEVFNEIEDCDGIREYASWEIFEKTLQLNKEYLALKDGWIKLKNYLDQRLSDYHFEGHIVSPETQELSAIINKMQELEEEV